MAENSSPAEAVHPDYEAWAPSWAVMRDTADGAEAVKAKREVYLPKPSGFDAIADQNLSARAYTAYITRAQFPDIVAPTIRGMSGVIQNKPATIELPEALEPIRERATRYGLTLEGLHERIIREVLTTGRYGLLADVTQDGEPYLAGYAAEAITNWGTVGDRLSFVTLDESGYAFDPETLEWENEERWRLAQIDETGTLVIRTFVKSGGGNGGDVEEGEPIFPRVKGGAALDAVPFTFIDTNDLTPEPEEVPLLGLAKVALAWYRLDADYRHQLYMTGQEMMVITGIEPDKAPTMIGSGIVMTLPEGGKAEIIGPQGKGIAAHRTAIQDERENAVFAGAQLLADQVASNESGEAKRLRLSNQHATLTSISKTVAAGLEAALRNCAVWIGADPEAVTVKPNLEFADVRMTPQEVTALVSAWQSEALSWQTLYENLQRGGVANPERDADEEQILIETAAPALGTIGMSEDPGDDEDADGEPE